MTNFDSPQNVVLPVVWFYLHPFAEEFLVEQFAVGNAFATFVLDCIFITYPIASCLRRVCAYRTPLRHRIEILYWLLRMQVPLCVLLLGCRDQRERIR